MKYVIDTSVGFKWAVSEIDSDKAIRLRDDFNNAIHELLAPDLFPTEIANALAVAERAGRIKPGDAAFLFLDILKNCPALLSAIPLLPRAIDLCLQTKQSVYDCLYVALAEKETCDFVTADDKLVRNLQPQFPFIKHLSSLPGPPTPSVP
jgi:predicted nucleic acid-binding protein